MFPFEPKPATNQFRTSLRAEFELIARRALVSTPVQASRLVPFGAFIRA